MAFAESVTPAHARAARELLLELGSSIHGLAVEEAASRLARDGYNCLPKPRPPGPLRVFLKQFLSPLIYVLVAASLISVAIGDLSDALFIAIVLLLNALIGTLQEYHAQRAAAALQRMVSQRVRVLRGGESHEIDAETLVPGDLVLLQSGDRVPADLRLIWSHDLQVDESLLTGESTSVSKDPDVVLPPETPLADRRNMLFAGSLLSRGRARAVVVATGPDTELGRLAEDILARPPAPAPLQVRMERFTRRIALLVLGAAALMGLVAAWTGMALVEVALTAVALAVSAIPEGLPVAITVALAIGMQRMARRHVIIRRLVAVEALGSCTLIASDKTGTLTVNQLTVRRLQLPGNEPWQVTGEGLEPTGTILSAEGALTPEEEYLLERLCLAAVLANEAYLVLRDGSWEAQGDEMDVALLVMARKIGLVKEELEERFTPLDQLPFESEHQYAAVVVAGADGARVFVKGAPERVLEMCGSMQTPEGAVPLDCDAIERQMRELAGQGFRTIAFAAGDWPGDGSRELKGETLRGLTFLGLAGIIDPLRPEARSAVDACREAGIEVVMITGDHPLTALAIGRDLGLARGEEELVTGVDLARAGTPEELDRLIDRTRIFARIEPRKKLEIVQSFQRRGHFVAVTGDGANDAPALRAAQVGVAMGRRGTDVARESADLILTDDNFASIVAGVEEGRIAYANVRKVIFLLVSTGAAEVVLFFLSLLSGMPLPLHAVQLLWLNLVTNGLQDVALAFEPGEGDELRQPPRHPRDPIFNRLMVERTVLAALLMGGVAWIYQRHLLASGMDLETSRNLLLMLMVLFENVHVFNCRSELRSVFRHSLLRNRILLLGTAAAQLVHIGALYTPGLSGVLGTAPIGLDQWLSLLGMALSILLVMELHKLLRRRWPLPPGSWRRSGP